MSLSLGLESTKHFMVGRVHELTGLRGIHNLGDICHCFAGTSEHRGHSHLHPVYIAWGDRISGGLTAHAARDGLSVDIADTYE